jgi:hypothetical protein
LALTHFRNNFVKRPPWSPSYGAVERQGEGVFSD